MSTAFVDIPAAAWNAIYQAIEKATAGREITFGRVVKRDAAKSVVWLEEFGDVSIPLVHFGYSFEYMDTDELGAMRLRGDKTQANDAFHVKIIVPRVGQMVAVLNPGSTNRFPMCVGVIQGTDYWQGE